MQFIADGYVIEGDALTTATNETIIRADSGVTATIRAAITGTGGLVKTDGGTLILAGSNSFLGGTAIRGGTVSILADANLGDASGRLTLDGGTLLNRADITSGRSILLGPGNGTFQTDANLMLAGSIAGDGRLIKTGAGGLILSNANHYGGGTAISDGFVMAAVSGALGNGPVDVHQGGELRFSDAASADSLAITLAGTLRFDGQSSAGTATISNRGTIYFHGHSTADNATIVNSAGVNGTGGIDISGLASDGIGIGSLAGDGGISLGSKALTLGNLGVDDRLGGMITDGGGVDGTGGSLIKTGAGTLTLAGVNSYTGGTGLAGGILSISSDANLGAASGGLTFDGGTLRNSAAFDTSRDIMLAGAGRLITDADLGIDGTFSGAGTLLKTGGGTLTLNGVSGNMGQTIIKEGALIIGSDTGHANAAFGGSLMMQSGTRLGGLGTLGSGAGSMVTIGSGATVAPGNSIGTLAINGDLTFAAGSIYEVEVDPTSSASDLIAVSGRATLNGGSVLHVGLNGAYPGKATYTIITAAGGVEGAFDNITSSFAFLDPVLGYSPNAVTLSLVRNDVDFCDVALTRNQCSAANGTQQLGSGPIFDTVLLLDDGGARAAFDLLSGEIYPSLQSVLVQDSRFPRNAALDRMSVAGADVDPAPGLRVWMQGLGSWGHIDSDGNARRIDHDSTGFLVGLDAIADEALQLGVFGGYQRGNADVRAAMSEADIDSYHLGLYAGTNIGRLGLRAGYVFSWHRADVTRRIAFGDFTDIARGRFHASISQAFGEVTYRFDLGTTRIEPFAQLAGVFVDSEQLRESGGPAALQIAHDHISVGFSTLGARAEQNFSLGAMKASIRASASWRRAFGDRLPVTAARFADSSSFRIAGTPVARDGLSADLGFSFAFSDVARLDIAYNGDVASDAELHSGRVTLSWAF